MTHFSPENSTHTVPAPSSTENAELDPASLRILRLSAGSGALTADETERLETAERNERIDLLMAESQNRVAEVRAELYAEHVRLKAAAEKKRIGRKLVRDFLRGTGRIVSDSEADALAPKLAKAIVTAAARSAS